MPVEISPLAAPDIPGVVSAIQKAFADDPFKNWAFDRTKFDAVRNAASLGVRCHWGIKNALFYVAKETGQDEVLGVAMWLPPRPAGQKQTWAEWISDWQLWFSQVLVNLRYGRGGLNVKRYFIWKEAQAKAQQELWTDPRGYYFLNIIVVAPEAQGKGIGKKLMATVTDKADAEHMPCYLESSKDQPNVGIYEHWGFRMAKTMECDDDGTACKLYSMIRDPR